MADLKVKFCGIESPNPFWLASGPPSNTAGQVMRAFDAGWGGAVWKTIGEPIQNTSSRYGAIDYNGVRVMGFNNIELISDRPIEVNLKEIAEVKKRYPKHLVIASLMVESKREAWHDIVERAEDAGSDALELNFGCPHGMSERGMGAAVGQVPDYTEMITSLGQRSRPHASNFKTHAQRNRHNANRAGSGTRRRRRGQPHQHNQFVNGSRSRNFRPAPSSSRKILARRLLRPSSKTNRPALSLQRSQKSKNSNRRHRRHKQLDRRRRTHSPRRLHSPSLHRRNALRFPHRRRHVRRPKRLHGRSPVPHHRRFPRPRRPQRKRLGRPDLNYKVIADINQDFCIGCQLCYVACEDGAHQCIERAPIAANPNGKKNAHNMEVHVPKIIDEECVGCNLCALVCPVDNCITMRQINTGQPPMSWNQKVASL